MAISRSRCTNLIWFSAAPSIPVANRSLPNLRSVRDLSEEAVVTPKVQSDKTLICENCGRYGAIQFGDRRLCDECYETMGSCCPEFGGFDLWEDKVENHNEESDLLNTDFIQKTF